MCKHYKLEHTVALKPSISSTFIQDIQIYIQYILGTVAAKVNLYEANELVCI